MTDLKQLKELAEKANQTWTTGGCATAGHSISSENDINEILAACGPAYKFEDENQYEKVIADAKFIGACSPQTILSLIERLEEADIIIKDIVRRDPKFTLHHAREYLEKYKK